MKTNSTALDALFDLLADEMKDQLANGKQAVDKGTGEVVRLSADAATLNVIRQFLKDNGIQALGEKSDALKSIVDSLPFNSDIDHTQAH